MHLVDRLTSFLKERKLSVILIFCEIIWLSHAFWPGEVSEWLAGAVRDLRTADKLCNATLFIPMAVLATAVESLASENRRARDRTRQLEDKD